MRLRMLGIAAVGKNHAAGKRAAAYCRRSFLGSAMLVFGDKMDAISRKRAFELVSIESPGELVVLLFQLQPKVKRGPIEVRVDDPSTGESGIRSMYRFCGFLS